MVDPGLHLVLRDNIAIVGGAVGPGFLEADDIEVSLLPSRDERHRGLLTGEATDVFRT